MPDARAEVLDEIRRICAVELEVKGQVDLGQELAGDLGVDSMGAVVLAVGLEDRFHVKLRDEDAAAVVTVSDLVDLVVRSVAETRPVAPGRGGAGR